MYMSSLSIVMHKLSLINIYLCAIYIPIERHISGKSAGKEI